MAIIPVSRQRQMLTFRGKKIGCTDTCLAMLGNGQALNGMLLTEQIVRDVSGEKNPDPASPGLNQSQLVLAASRLHFTYTDKTGGSWASFGAAVTARRLVVAQLWYAVIGGTAIGHAVLVIGRNDSGSYVYIDPMTGIARTATPTTFHKAMSAFSVRTGLPATKLRFGVSRPVPAAK